MKKVRIYCIEQLDGGTSFGVCEDTGESVFIPASVSKRVGLDIGDSAVASLIPNATHTDKTPWYAIFVTKSEAHVEPEPEPEDDLLVQVERLLLGTRGYFTAEEVADACDVDPVEAQEKLDHLFDGGHIRRAVVQQVPNGDVELTLWAMNVADFLAEDE
jgi:hypothetical protein